MHEVDFVLDQDRRDGGPALVLHFLSPLLDGLERRLKKVGNFLLKYLDGAKLHILRATFFNFHGVLAMGYFYEVRNIG